MTSQISWQDGSFMSVTYSGKTSAQEILQVVRLQHGDERFDALRKVLHDFSGIESCSCDEGSLEELDAMGAGGAYSNPYLRIAIVSTRQDVMQMLSEFLKQGVSPYPMQVFPTVTQARIWLDN